MCACVVTSATGYLYVRQGCTQQSLVRCGANMPAVMAADDKSWKPGYVRNLVHYYGKLNRPAARNGECSQPLVTWFVEAGSEPVLRLAVSRC